MSHIFERPLCEMGRAYDFAYRSTVGDPEVGDGGACDDRPHRIELFAAAADRAKPDADWQAFAVCPDHEAQLRRYDDRLAPQGIAPRFRSAAASATAPGRGR